MPTIGQNGQKLHFWPFLTANCKKLRIFPTIKIIKLCETTEKPSETFIFTSNGPLYGGKLMENGEKLAKMDKNHYFSPFLLNFWHLFCI